MVRRAAQMVYHGAGIHSRECMQKTRALGRVAILIACLQIGAAAQQPAGQQPAFRSGVEVVLIDVTVVDRSGAPIGNLRPEDFQVSVDHKPRAIASAQFVEYRMQVQPGAANAAVREAPASSRPPVPAGRNVLIVFDEDSLDTGDALQAKKAAERFLDQLGPDDRIGVVTIPWLRSRTDLTTKRADVRKAIAAVSAGTRRDTLSRYQIGLAEAFDIERGDGGTAEQVVQRECLQVATRAGFGEDIKTCRTQVLMDARNLAMQAHLRGQRSLDALSQVGFGLGRIDGPKTVLFISGGMPMPDPDTISPFDNLEAMLGAGQVTLYTLYLERTSGQAKMKASPTALQDALLEREAVEHVTSVAGGTLMHGIGTLDQYFTRVATELSGSYLVGIEVAPADRDGRPHQVDVKVNRQGVDVRARKQYVIEPARAAAPPEDLNRPVVTVAFRGAEYTSDVIGAGGRGVSPFHRTATVANLRGEVKDIKLRIKASHVKKAANGAGEVVVQMTIDSARIGYKAVEDRHVAALEVSVFCGDAREAVVGEVRYTIDLKLKADMYRRYLHDGIPFNTRVPVKAEPRWAKIIVYDPATDLVGSVVRKLK
jgi:VWFA-related protein